MMEDVHPTPNGHIQQPTTAGAEPSPADRAEYEALSIARLGNALAALFSGLKEGRPPDLDLLVQEARGSSTVLLHLLRQVTERVANDPPCPPSQLPAIIQLLQRVANKELALALLLERIVACFWQGRGAWQLLVVANEVGAGLEEAVTNLEAAAREMTQGTEADRDGSSAAT